MEFLSSSEFDYLTFSSYVLLLSPVVWEVQEPVYWPIRSTMYLAEEKTTS